MAEVETAWSTCLNFNKFYSNDSSNSNDGEYENLFLFYKRFSVYHTWITITLCSCGLLANVVTSVILTRKNMTSTINNLLTSVAVFDSCLLITYFIFVVHFKFLPKCAGIGLTRPWAVFALLHANLSIVLRAYSLWLSVVVAGYRKTILYRNQPLIDENSRFAPAAITTVLITVAIVASPIFLGNSISEEKSPVNNSQCRNGDSNGGAGGGESFTFYRVVPSEHLFVYDCFLLKVNHFINAVLLKLLPCSFLTYYFWAIIKLLCKRSRSVPGRVLSHRSNSSYYSQRRNRQQKDLKNHCSRRCRCWRRLRGAAIAIDNNRQSFGDGYSNTKFHPTTIILASILLMTLLCELPNALTSALSGLLSVEYYWLVYQNLGDLFDVLSLFNGLTTFLTYCTMSSAFRSTFLDLFQRSPRCEQQKNVGGHQQSTIDRDRCLRSVLNGGDKRTKIDNDNNNHMLIRETTLQPNHHYVDENDCNKKPSKARVHKAQFLNNREIIVENLFASDDDSEH